MPSVVLILDGYSEKGARVANLAFMLKTPVFPRMCATCSDLPSERKVDIEKKNS